MNGFDDADFQIEPFVGRPFHAGIDLGELVDQVDETFGGDEWRLGIQRLEQVWGHVPGGGGVDFVNEQVTEVADGVGEQAGEVFAAICLLVDLFEGGGRIFFQQG